MDCFRRSHVSTPRSKVNELLSKALDLTVIWDEPRLAAKVISLFEDQQPGEETQRMIGEHAEVGNALLCALRMQKVAVVQMLLALPGISLLQVGMCSLYLTSFNECQARRTHPAL